MTKIKISKIILTIWILHYIIINTYFGWNKLPINDAELFQDKISKILLYLSVFIYLLPIYELYEDSIRRLEKRNNLK